MTAAAPEECESEEYPAVVAAAVSSKGGISPMDDSGEEGGRNASSSSLVLVFGHGHGDNSLFDGSRFPPAQRE